MINWARPGLTDALSILLFMAGALSFGVAVLLTRIGTRAAPASADGNSTSRGSWIGVAIQALAMMLSSGPVHVFDFTPAAAPRAATVGLLMAAAVALFAWSARTMGRNWAVVARTRADHQLVTSGPFALVRNPIYLAMGLFLLGLAIATGHARALWITIPVFLVGTMIRIRAEEALLEKRFGEPYRAYKARVKRLVPGVF